MSSVNHAAPRFYGRRKGRSLRQQAQAALDAAHHQLAFTPEEPFFESHGEQEAWIEIGFGGGEHLLAQLRQFPKVRFLGCEAYQNGVAMFSKALLPADQARVRLFSEDVRKCLGMLPEASFSRAFILFPDPWPKKRHHKRRLLQPAFLDALGRILKPQAQVRVASDDLPYVTWILEIFEQHQAFSIGSVNTVDTQSWPEDWPRTRYGNKALEQGKTCTLMVFEKRGSQYLTGAIA